MTGGAPEEIIQEGRRQFVWNSTSDDKRSELTKREGLPIVLFRTSSG